MYVTVDELYLGNDDAYARRSLDDEDGVEIQDFGMESEEFRNATIGMHL